MTDIDKQVKEIELCASAHCDDGNVATGLVLGKAADTIAAQSKRIEGLEKQVEALKGLDEWEPIETAPKDGSWFLACGGIYNGNPYLLKYSQTSLNENVWQLFDGSRPYDHCHKFWRALPTPPKDMGGVK